jgi:hypothetical protein
MEHEARSIEEYPVVGRRAEPALPDIASVAWRPTDDWPWPEWLPEEPAPAGLPMTGWRMRWCLLAIGWSLGELSRRVHTHESNIRKMGRDQKPIPDTLAIWLEEKAAMMLGSPLEPRGWRPKPPVAKDWDGGDIL